MVIMVLKEVYMRSRNSLLAIFILLSAACGSAPQVAAPAQVVPAAQPPAVQPAVTLAAQPTPTDTLTPLPTATAIQTNLHGFPLRSADAVTERSRLNLEKKWAWLGPRYWKVANFIP